jgi:hypothetical protein
VIIYHSQGHCSDFRMKVIDSGVRRKTVKKSLNHNQQKRESEGFNKHAVNESNVNFKRNI